MAADHTFYEKKNKKLFMFGPKLAVAFHSNVQFAFKCKIFRVCIKIWVKMHLN